MEVDSPPPEPTAEADPIVASYDIYTNPSLPAGRKLLILQHPNKQGPVNVPYAQLGEVRVKPRSGMLEVDVPVGHAHADYDRDKGLRWGAALARSVAAKNGGSHGLAGGFGVGVPAVRGGGGGGGGGGKRRADEYDKDADLLDWTEAVRQDKVLRTQTLGGQFPNESQTNCRYMVGVFKGNQLHLTPASALIHLRPQLHHVDATTEQGRLARPHDGAAAAGPAPGAKEPGAAPPGQAARAIHMSIKSAGTGSGELTTETMTDRLRSVQMEPWRRLKYEDDESPRAWNVFADNLVYRGASAESQDKGADNYKGKGKEKATTMGATEDSALDVDADADAADAEQQQQQLRVRWGADEFLRAVSGMKDGPDGGEKIAAADRAPEVKKEEEAAGQTPSAAAARGKGKGAAPAAARKATKGKSVAFKSTAMEID
ncbi:Sin-like protein conserved region-domain-containing protein [Biscogniauxia marginata]|nr:Sin-like protein conserved region-domain-containing protein [Biscogniauxia marginata]